MDKETDINTFERVDLLNKVSNFSILIFYTVAIYLNNKLGNKSDSIFDGGTEFEFILFFIAYVLPPILAFIPIFIKNKINDLDKKIREDYINKRTLINILSFLFMVLSFLFCIYMIKNYENDYSSRSRSLYLILGGVLIFLHAIFSGMNYYLSSKIHKNLTNTTD